MKKSIEQQMIDCDNAKSCVKCENYLNCVVKYKSKELTNEKNNPSTLNAEIRRFDFDIYKDEQDRQEEYKINIAEASQSIINTALISLFQIKENPELINIIRAALNKFSVEPNNSAEIFKSKDGNKYHLVFECVDCTSINDSTEYVNGDSITIYCKYCGKRHRFNIKKDKDE